MSAGLPGIPIPMPFGYLPPPSQEEIERARRRMLLDDAHARSSTDDTVWWWRVGLGGAALLLWIWRLI